MIIMLLYFSCFYYLVFSSEWVACVDDVAVTVFELVLFVFRVPVLVRIVFWKYGCCSSGNLQTKERVAFLCWRHHTQQYYRMEYGVPFGEGNKSFVSCETYVLRFVWNDCFRAGLAENDSFMVCRSKREKDVHWLNWVRLCQFMVCSKVEKWEFRRHRARPAP